MKSCINKASLTLSYLKLTKLLKINTNDSCLYLLGLLVIDGGDKLWLWCGWWESGFTTDTRGSAWCRHLAERRAAMTSCLDYWAKRNRSSDTNTSSCVFVVWAGLEPVQFSSLFPVWDTSSEKYNNARQFNIEVNRKKNKYILYLVYIITIT